MKRLAGQGTKCSSVAGPDARLWRARSRDPVRARLRVTSGGGRFITASKLTSPLDPLLSTLSHFSSSRELSTRVRRGESALH